MTKPHRGDISRAALRAVNDLRGAMGLALLDDLPAGETCPDTCPIALALSEPGVGADVGSMRICWWSDRNSTDARATEWARLAAHLWSVRRNGNEVFSTPAIRAFVWRYDDGHFPKYEAAP